VVTLRDDVAVRAPFLMAARARFLVSANTRDLRVMSGKR
jgi:hypothetical protein